MSDNAPGPASTPSHDDALADRALPRSSASESASTPADSTSARSTSAEADAVRSASADAVSPNPLESSFKTTATPGGVHMSNEVFQDLVVKARAGGAVMADDRKDAVFHPSFRVGGSTFLATVKVWFGSPLVIPDDLVRAFNAGNNVPLSLLTVAAIRDYGINQRRSVFQPQMTGRLLEEFGTWHSRDDYLPFAEWCQAIFTLIHLFRSVREVPPDETQEDDPIFQLTEHALTIISRVNAYTWPVYREYDKRVRQEIWSARHKGIPVPFRINSLHIPTLDDAEIMVKGRGGALADYAAMLESGWSAVVTAHPSEVAKFGKRLNDAHAASAASIKEDPLAPPPQTLGVYSGSRSGASGKRKAADEADASPGRNRSAHQSFQRSVSAPFFPSAHPSTFPPPQQPSFQHSPFPGFTPVSHQSFPTHAPSGPKGPAFCSVCLAFTGSHSWDSCPGPYPDGLASSPFGKGWLWKGKLRTACARWNAGTPEPNVECHFGHYCMQCGQDGCRARDHGTRDSSGNVLSAGAPSGAGSGAGAAPSYNH
ncbi:hypothetical protein A4X13_0g2207 [Tilletia indica]|uniref:Uncharacterized protein n=1 Tax=Tilletia indica TaxID=43049 RepID=A0A177TRB2_9BASI|nr:hypothetical protein A4X13_0g2207 [Tilletia indica]